MRVDGIDPVQLDKVYDKTQKPIIQEIQRQDPTLKQQNKVLGKEQRILEWEESHMEELQEGVERLNSTANVFNTGLRFLIHEETNRIMVQVVDLKEDEVIREIPPEKILNMVAQIQNIIGLFIDTRR
ncbi:MAG: flagellar protein FlaG [Dethiobacteria bacterium]